MDKQETARIYWKDLYRKETQELYNKPKYELWLEMKAFDLANSSNDIQNVRHCAFQYYNGITIVCDADNLTIEEAKDLWNEHYDDMVEKAADGEEIEVAIWVNMESEGDYRDTMIHLSSPEVRNGMLYEPKYYRKL